MKLKIIIATHKPYAMPNGAEYLPLQVGASGKDSFGFARDDTGENISARNANWCELTAIYWAWKNLEADAIGLMHYRRHFCLAPSNLAARLSTHDLILPPKRHYLIETNYSQYIHAHHAIDLDETRCIFAERGTANEIAAFDRVMKRTSGHRFNMFVMRRTVFLNYCEWLFPILFELERRLDLSSYSKNDARVFGFVAERLLDVYLELHPELSFIEIPVRNLEPQHWPTKILSFLKRKFYRHA